MCSSWKCAENIAVQPIIVLLLVTTLASSLQCTQVAILYSTYTAENILTQSHHHRSEKVLIPALQLGCKHWSISRLNKNMLHTEI